MVLQLYTHTYYVQQHSIVRFGGLECGDMWGGVVTTTDIRMGFFGPKKKKRRRRKKEYSEIHRNRSITTQWSTATCLLPSRSNAPARCRLHGLCYTHIDKVLQSRSHLGCLWSKNHVDCKCNWWRLKRVPQLCRASDKCRKRGLKTAIMGGDKGQSRERGELDMFHPCGGRLGVNRCFSLAPLVPRFPV